MPSFELIIPCLVITHKYTQSYGNRIIITEVLVIIRKEGQKRKRTEEKRTRKLEKKAAKHHT